MNAAVVALTMAVQPAPLVTAVMPTLPAYSGPAPLTAAVPTGPTPLQSLSALSVDLSLAAAKGEQPKALDLAFDQRGVAPPAAVELVHAAMPSLFDKTAVARGVAEGRLSYGAELASPNPVSAATLASGGAVSALFVDASKAERGALSALVNAVANTPAIVVGRFSSASDPTLKPKLDEGLLGATLTDAQDARSVRRFLDKLYLPPLGRRSVGPSDVTRYLGAVKDFTTRSNSVFLGGVTIGTKKGVSNIEAIVALASKGLRFVEVDATRLTGSEVRRVEKAALEAGVALFGRARSREQALALHRRGYRHVVVATDEGAVEAAADAYEDVPKDAAKEPALGAWAFLMSPDLRLARRMAARAGGLWIDGEDGHFTPAQVAALKAGAGAASVVRATGWDDPEIGGYAKGAWGVVAPQVGNAREARAFVAAVRRADPQAKAVVMVENARAVKNLDAILAVPGIDCVFIGPYDLALSLGLEPTSAAFKDAVALVESKARAAGVPLGGLSKSRSETYALKAKGYEFVAVFSDQGALAAAVVAVLGPASAAAGY